MTHCNLITGELYIVCQFNYLHPNGRLSIVCSSLKEAKETIDFQVEQLHSTSKWKILHIKESEFIDYAPSPKKNVSIEELYKEDEDEPYWNK